jgi:hypothetical protein
MADRFVAGDTPRLTNSFYVDDVLTDPTTISLAVTDPSGNTDTYTYAGATITKSSTGVYYKDVTVDEDGVWEYTWTGTGTAADIATGSLSVWPASSDDIDVLTLPEAKQAVGLVQTNTDLDDYLSTLVTAVSGQLDQLCGAVRNRTVTDEVHDGGCSTIRLHRIPVYSVTSVAEYNSTTSTTLTAETNASKAAGNYVHDGSAGTLRSGTIRRRSSNSDYTFAEGRRNVVVTYVAGRAANTEVVPAKFKQAAAMMLRNIWIGEQASGSQTFGAFSDIDINPLLGPGMLNKVAALLTGEILEGVYVG